AISGMLPLQHAQVTIIKLHGHYLDTRLKNTQLELSQYDPELNQLLDRIFDEYGLLICGWSGIWDIALREAILRCPSRRFTTYWTTLGELAEEAKVLATHRQALILRISSADSFFQELAETVTALEDLDKPNPLTTAVAVATLKRLLPLEEQR